jgi:hypothetical protein
MLLGIAILFGGIFGWLFSYIYAAILSWTGEWINGKEVVVVPILMGIGVIYIFN